MRAFIFSGWFTFLILIAGGSSAMAAETLPSDAVIQQRIVGTWRLNWMVFTTIRTISTNGDYVDYQSNGQWTNRFEGSITVRDGLMIDTVKKSSTTNQPMPLVLTNVVIRVTDDQLMYRTQDKSRQLYLWERSKH